MTLRQKLAKRKDKKIPQFFCKTREATNIGQYEVSSQEEFEKMKEDRRTLARLNVPHLISITTPTRWPLVMHVNIYTVTGVRHLEDDGA